MAEFLFPGALGLATPIGHNNPLRSPSNRCSKARAIRSWKPGTCSTTLHDATAEAPRHAKFFRNGLFSVTSSLTGWRSDAEDGTKERPAPAVALFLRHRSCSRSRGRLGEKYSYRLEE